MGKKRTLSFVFAVLVALLMLGPVTASARAGSPPTIVVRPGEGADLLPMGDGTEPPPHIIIYTPDGDLRLVDPNR